MIAADVAYDALRVRVNQVLLEGSVIFDLPSIPKKQAQICTYVFSPTHSKNFVLPLFRRSYPSPMNAPESFLLTKFYEKF